ncbi:MAG: TetR/AcrR family transcriptional regulator [Ornithinibacter sp.]
MISVKRTKQPNRPTRREQARSTRLRIVRAAHAVFVDRGYGGARMTDIAEAAGVAVQTVYFTFHTKGELLQACYEAAVLGEEEPSIPVEQPWYAAMLAAEDGSAMLREFAVGNSGIATRVAGLDEVIHATRHEPDAVAVRQRSEVLRREGYAQVITRLDSRFGLRPDLAQATATDLLLLFGGAAVYRELVVDLGWEHDDFAAWLHTTLVAQLLGRRDGRCSDRRLGSPGRQG